MNFPVCQTLPRLGHTQSHLPSDPAAFSFFTARQQSKDCFCCYVTGAFPTFINSSEAFCAVPFCRGRAEAGVAVG